MKVQFIIAVFTISQWFVGCKPIIYTIHDVRQVQPQSNRALIEFCRQKNIDTEHLRRVKEEALYSNLQKHLNQHCIFDSLGVFIDYAHSFENPRCKGNILQVLKNPNSLKTFPRDSSISLDGLLGQTVEVNDEPADTASLPASYTIVMFWNTFSGNPNHKRAFKDLKEAIQHCPTGMFRLVLVNQDYHPGTIPRIQMK
jgi:hypothetical protein